MYKKIRGMYPNIFEILFGKCKREISKTKYNNKE